VLNEKPSYRRCVRFLIDLMSNVPLRKFSDFLSVQCVSECVLNATGILDLGRVNSVKAIAVLEKPFKDNDTLKMVKSAINDCVTEIAEKAIYMAMEIGTHPPPDAIRFCHPRSGVFTACVNGRVFQVKEVSLGE
jgi:hypothetical protein